MTKSYNSYKDSMMNKGVDRDNFAGWQCWDGVADYQDYLGTPMTYTKVGESKSGYVKDIWLNRLTNGILDHYIEVTELEPGDIVVFKEHEYTPTSHIAIYDSDYGNGFGNFFGQNQGNDITNPNGGSAFNITQIPYDAMYPTAFRLKSNNTQKEDYTLPKYINVNLMNTGNMYSIKGVVIHNDAGSMNPEQYVNWLRNRDKSLGIAHYYINKDVIARVVDTYRIAYHCGDGVSPTSGNGNYIGYEVCQSMSANDKDFLANEDMTLMQATEDLIFYGLPINTTTVKLHHEFVPTSCPHRSMALHGNTTASVKSYFIERMKHFAKLGKTVDEMLKNSSKTQSTTKTSTKASAKPSGTFKVEALNRDKGEFAVRLSNIKSPDGISKVYFPTWTTDNGQDDIIWHEGVKQSNGTYLFATGIGKHKNGTGEYNVHAYIVTPDGVKHFIGGDKFNMTDEIKGTITVTNINTDSGTFQVNLKGIKTGNNIKRILFPTWTTTKGQDDLNWYVGTKHSDGTYSCTVHIKDHGNEFGEYVIHVYGETSLGVRKAIGGTKIEFKEELNSTTTSSKPEVIIITKDDIDVNHIVLTKEEYEKIKNIKK